MGQPVTVEKLYELCEKLDAAKDKITDVSGAFVLFLPSPDCETEFVFPSGLFGRLGNWVGNVGAIHTL